MPGLIWDHPPPAPMVVGPATKTATLPSEPLAQYLIDDAKLTMREEFDAAKHLNIHSGTKTISMKEIGLEGRGISPTAVLEPFQLFTEEGIQQIKAEVFSGPVLRDCQFSSNFNKHMIRGIGPARAPFTYNAWKSPELLAKVSEVAGIDLVTALDYEVANINIAVNTGDAEVAKSDTTLGDDLPSVAWHYDSFPFVCVVMLSDCTGMVGGETAVRMPTGGIMKVRGPTMGSAVVLQGRYIEHQALKALGGKERISMVTCFRPKSSHIRDETVLTGVRAISHKPELYTQYFEYRLEIIEERIRAKLKDERRREQSKKVFNTTVNRAWLMEQKEFLEAMLYEITDE